MKPMPRVQSWIRLLRTTVPGDVTTEEVRARLLSAAPEADNGAQGRLRLTAGSGYVRYGLLRFDLPSLPPGAPSAGVWQSAHRRPAFAWASSLPR